MAEPFIGMIQPFAFNYAPQGWSTCEGQLMTVNQNPALFALIGATYGGNGSSNFALPDLRGRTMLHQGTQPGGPSYQFGQAAGSATTTLVQGNLPGHTHTLTALGGPGTLATPGGNVLANAAGFNPTSSEAVDVTVYAPAGSPMVPMAPGAIGVTGNGQPFPSMPPYLALTVCIALQGIYPSRP